MMGPLTQVLIENHERSIRALKNDLNNLYEKDKANGTVSKDEATEILEDIKKHRELIKALEATKQT